jgi:hypothetical protein
MSNPALKVTRIALHRVATPVPKTRSRAETILLALADTDARIGCAMRLFVADAAMWGRIDLCAFHARGEALLHDLETATQLVTALLPLEAERERWLRDRARGIDEQRRQVERLLLQASP